MLGISRSLCCSCGFCVPAGGTAQEVGGPFDKEGSVGHQFTTDGGIGEWEALSLEMYVLRTRAHTAQSLSYL